MKGMSAFGLAIFLFTQPVSVAAGVPGDQVRQTVDKLVAILKDPRLKQADNKNERREALKKLIYQRFDFTEMARRALGPEWRRHSPEEQKEFVTMAPKTFAPVKGAWGRNGSTRVELAAVRLAPLRKAMAVAWRRRAPKRLLEDR